MTFDNSGRINQLFLDHFWRASDICRQIVDVNENFASLIEQLNISLNLVTHLIVETQIGDSNMEVGPFLLNMNGCMVFIIAGIGQIEFRKLKINVEQIQWNGTHVWLNVKNL